MYCSGKRTVLWLGYEMALFQPNQLVKWKENQLLNNSSSSGNTTRSWRVTTSGTISGLLHTLLMIRRLLAPQFLLQTIKHGKVLRQFPPSDTEIQVLSSACSKQFSKGNIQHPHRVTK